MDHNTIDTLIVDDEPLARNRLRNLCSRLENISGIRVACDGREAIQAIDQAIPDLILLDVDMPDISGIDVAEYCQFHGKNAEIVFTTAHSKYAVRAFRLQATDFLLKPVKQSLLAEAVDRVSERLGRYESDAVPPEDFYLWVKEGNGSLQVRCADIEYVVADRDYMRLCLKENSYLVHGSMQSLIDKLPKNMFARIHRSTLVRKDFVQEVRRSGRRTYALLKNGTDLTIGASYTNGLQVQAGGFGLLETVSE